jgi:hypothetical protein
MFVEVMLRITPPFSGYCCICKNLVPVPIVLDSAVGIETGYGLNDRGIEVRVQVGSIIFSSRRPDRL